MCVDLLDICNCGFARTPIGCSGSVIVGEGGHQTAH